MEPGLAGQPMASAANPGEHSAVCRSVLQEGYHKSHAAIAIYIAINSATCCTASRPVLLRTHCRTLLACFCHRYHPDRERTKAFGSASSLGLSAP